MNNVIRVIVGICFTFNVAAYELEVELTQTIPIGTMTMDQALALARENALTEASEKLPGLLFGEETQKNEHYSIQVRRYSAAVFHYLVLTEFIDRATNTLTVRSRVTFDAHEAIRILKPIADGANAMMRLESLSTDERNEDMRAATFSLSMLDRARRHESTFKAQSLDYGTDAYLLAQREAQERILFEVMKDIYVSFMVPTIQAVERTASSYIKKDVPKSKFTVADNHLIIEFKSDAPLVDGALERYPSKETVSAEDEIEVLLAPYNARWPFITAKLINSRIYFCSPEGYPRLLGEVRPPYIKEIRRREEGRLHFSMKGDSITKRQLNIGSLGVCIGNSQNYEKYNYRAH